MNKQILRIQIRQQQSINELYKRQHHSKYIQPKQKFASQCTRIQTSRSSQIIAQWRVNSIQKIKERRPLSWWMASLYIHPARQKKNKNKTNRHSMTRVPYPTHLVDFHDPMRRAYFPIPRFIALPVHCISISLSPIHTRWFVLNFI